MATHPIETIDSALIERVKKLIEKKDRKALLEIINAMRQADAADLIEYLEPEERVFIFEILEPEWAGDVLVEIESPVQESILEQLDDDVISSIIEELDSDDAADLIGDLPKDRAKQIIDSVEEKVSDEISQLLRYPEDTAGGIMGLEFVAVRADATIKDAIETIREKREDVENLYYIWVLDNQDRLVGVVSLKDLLLEPPEKKVRDIMNTEVISVNINADQEEVAKIVKKYDLVNIPVVDDQNRLVGRITHDDIIDVIEEETDEDISRMAGVIDQEIGETSPFKISRARIPWLTVTLFGELISASVISKFEVSLEKVIALTFFFPVIMALGGSSGNQAATIIVRGLATGDINMVNVKKHLITEIKVAFVNGFICGVLLGSIVGLWVSDLKLGAVVALATILIFLNSELIGASVPFIMKKLGIDPALATVPFVSTSNDILGLLIYLSLVTMYLMYS